MHRADRGLWSAFERPGSVRVEESPAVTHEALVRFLFSISLFFATTYLVAYVCGYFVQYRGLKVNYSRKIGHFMTIGVPWALQRLLDLEENWPVVALTSVLAPMHLLLFTRPIRDRSRVVRMMFASLDRPEDRPHTLRWLWTQYVAGYAVFLVMYAMLLDRGVAAWATIAIMVNVLGDGLAEPVGVAFGRHKFNCPALFTRRKYCRTLEGSACVFLSGLLGVLLVRPEFAPLQFYLALLIIPISAALAEAYSPHTWDAPFLFLVVGGELVALTYV
jgi:phytol kinase